MTRHFTSRGTTSLSLCYLPPLTSRMLRKGCPSVSAAYSTRQVLARQGIMSQEVSGDRRMKYPYTVSAKLAFFPYRYYYKHAWVAKYYVFGFFLTIPVMVAITNAVNNPENKAKWAEIRRKEFSGENHH